VQRVSGLTAPAAAFTLGVTIWLAEGLLLLLTNPVTGWLFEQTSNGAVRAAGMATG
jgi:hypothetical protein